MISASGANSSGPTGWVSQRMKLGSSRWRLLWNLRIDKIDLAALERAEAGFADAGQQREREDFVEVLAEMFDEDGLLASPDLGVFHGRREKGEVRNAAMMRNCAYKALVAGSAALLSG
jgi:hypothetical protein